MRLRQYVITKTVEVEYYYNIEAKSKKEALRILESRILEDNYLWIKELDNRIEEV